MIAYMLGQFPKMIKEVFWEVYLFWRPIFIFYGICVAFTLILVILTFISHALGII